MQRFDDIFQQLDELAALKPYGRLSTGGGRVQRTSGAAHRVWRAVVNTEAESRSTTLRMLQELYDVTNDMVASLLGVEPIDPHRPPVRPPTATTSLSASDPPALGALSLSTSPPSPCAPAAASRWRDMEQSVIRVHACHAPSGAAAPPGAQDEDLTASRVTTRRDVMRSQERFFDTCSEQLRERLVTLRAKLAASLGGIVQLTASTYRDDETTVACLFALHNYATLIIKRLERALTRPLDTAARS